MRVECVHFLIQVKRSEAFVCHVQTYFRLLGCLAGWLTGKFFSGINKFLDELTVTFFRVLFFSCSCSETHLDQQQILSRFAIWYLFQILTKRRKVSRKRSVRLGHSSDIQKSSSKKKRHTLNFGTERTAFGFQSQAEMSVTNTLYTYTWLDQQPHRVCWRCDTKRCVYFVDCGP